MKMVDSKVLNILDGSTIIGNVVKLNSGQLDRKLYADVNKVLEALGGKWNRKVGGHTFASDPSDIFDEVLLTGEYSPDTTKQDFGVFFTPAWLAEKVVDMADIRREDTILEPSAGEGAIADAVLRRCPWAAPNLDLNEIQPEKVKFIKGKGYANVLQYDFLSSDFSKAGYDKIVMNPPFAKQADIKHVLKAWELLNAGGRLVSIMSAAVKFRSTNLTTAFREIIAKHGVIEDVPEGAFKESGTNVSTVMVVLDKAA